MKKTYIRGIATKAADGTFRVLASTAAIDRQGDTVRQDGWELENFKKNPVILWAHNYDELPIGKATDIGVSVQGLEITFEFAPAEGNPKAAQVQKLMEEGFLSAVSVGFIPKERNGNVIIRSELLELSVVPVPANQEALRLAMSKGLDVSAIEKDLEEGEKDEKGAVADELSAEDVMRKKWGLMDGAYKIVYALCSVFLDEKTSVDSFAALAGEAGDLLKAYAGNPAGATEGEGAVALALSEGKAMKQPEAEAKEGRTLSSATRSKINKTRDALTDSVAALDELLLSDAEKSSHEDNGNDSETVSVEKDDLRLMRSILRGNDRSTEAVLTAVSNLLKSKGATN